MTSCQSSAEVSAAGARRIMPALLTSTLRSLELAPAPRDQVRRGVRRQRAEIQLPGRAAAAIPSSGSSVDSTATIRAGLGERERHRIAQAARGSRDERTLAAQREAVEDPFAHRISDSRYCGSTPADS